MSNDNTAKEAEAEGVRPLSEKEVEAKRREITRNLADNARLQERVKVPIFTTVKAEEALSLIATLDAARAELERKEAEAAVRQKAFNTWMRTVKLGVEDGEFWIECDHATLDGFRDVMENPPQAGAALLERVRQLEGENERLRRDLEFIHRYAQEADISVAAGLALLPKEGADGH